ncbi:MAG: Ig-like domain-containing protein [Leeuwenhoekiella sp.]
MPTVDFLTTSDTTPLITGTADSSADLTVTVNGIVYTENDGNLTDNGDGTWELQIPGGNTLSEGIYDVSATSTDSVGNVSTDITIDEITIDTTPPVVPTVDFQTTADTTPQITGTAESTALLTVTVNGIMYTEGDGNLIDNGNGIWALQIPEGNELPESVYDVIASLTDDAGNSSSDTTIDELVIDPTAPELPTVNFLTTADTTPLLTGTADSNAGLTVTVNGIVYTKGDGILIDNGDGTWELQIPDLNMLSEGIFDVLATSTDEAGNSSSDNTVDELIIDTTAPATPTVNFLTTADTTPIITGTADSDALLTVRVNGITYTEEGMNLVVNADNTWQLQIPQANEIPIGNYDIIAISTDNLDNSSSDTTLDELTIIGTSLTAPTVNFLTTSDTTPVITGTASSVAELNVSVNGISYNEGDADLSDNGDGTWTLNIPQQNGLVPGVYDIVATLTDNAGNTIEDQTVDELTITVATPTGDADQTFCASDNATLINVELNVESIIWYDSQSGGTVLSSDTILVNGRTYYAAQISNGMESSDRFAVTISLTTVTSPTTESQQQVFCESENAMVSDLQVNEENVVWYSSADGDDLLPMNTLLINGTTYYAAQVSGGCESTERLAVAVVITQQPDISITSSSDNACLGTSITYSTEDEMNNYNWEIDAEAMVLEGGTSTDNFITVIWNEPGTQSVSVSYDVEESCSGSGSAEATLNVTVVSCSDLTLTITVDNTTPIIGAEVVFTIRISNNGDSNFSAIEVDQLLGSGFELISAETASGSFNSIANRWILDTLSANATAELNIRATILEINDYVNTVEIINSDPQDSDLSNNSATIELFPDCLKIFNEFSPNGDGLNDLFKIRCIANYPNNTLQVYNRDGNKVYGKRSYNNEWNGDANVSGIINKGQRLPAGTYYYVLDLGDGTKSLSGWLYIAR